MRPEEHSEDLGPGPEPIDRCPAAREGMDDEALRKQVQADAAAGKVPHPPLPPDTPPDIPPEADA